MARPRPQPDPQRWPHACARCHQHYPVAAIWPEGRICRYCYMAAKRQRGTCSCGHQGVLPGLVEGQPVCRQCSGIRLNVDCRRCGAEGELYRAGRCLRCELDHETHRLLADPETGRLSPQMKILASALKSMERPGSGLNWIRQSHVQAFFEQARSCDHLTHEALNELPDTRTREYVRGLLVEHGALPTEDIYRRRFEEWLNAALPRAATESDRSHITRFVRWQLLRPRAGSGPLTQASFLRCKQTVTVTISFLNWLHDQGSTLDTLTQLQLDEWQATGPSTREIASRFIAWAVKTGLTDPELRITPHRRGTAARLSPSEQQVAIDTLVLGDELPVRERVVAILVLVFGQPMERVVALTWDDLTITKDAVTLQLGTGEALKIPSPLDNCFRALRAHAKVTLTATHREDRWLFPGRQPGQHLSAGYLSSRLRSQMALRAARLGSLQEMSRMAPPALLAELLGYSPFTIEAHATTGSSHWSGYIEALRDTGDHV